MSDFAGDESRVDPALLLGFAAYPPAKLDEAAGRLAACLASGDTESDLAARRAS